MLLFLFYVYFKIALKANPQLNTAFQALILVSNTVENPAYYGTSDKSKIAESYANSPGMGVWSFPLTTPLQSPKY